MESNLYERIQLLCQKRGVTISRLETELGFGNSSVKKWKEKSSPSIDKIIKIASYFDVSIDYLAGRTDIEGSISDILEDDAIMSLQRARQKMSQKDKDNMMQMVKCGFDYAFSEEEDK